ncbi:putative ribonuclease H-like domain-containing protein [Tanacetum coccineum]
MISYIKPFGCHVTILDTLSVLGKFDGKSDEGFLVGYSLYSKGYRVYNLVQVAITPLGPSSPTYCRKSGTRKPSTNSKKEECLIELQNLKSQENEASPKGITEDAPDILAFLKELDKIAQKHLGAALENNTTSTPSVNTGNGSVNTGKFDASQHPDTDDSDMPELEIFNRPKQGIFDAASYDEEDVVTDFNNLPTKVTVSPIPTLRIHNIHPQSQILSDPKSSVQTRSRVKQTSGAQQCKGVVIVSANSKDSSNLPLRERVIVYQTDFKKCNFMYGTIDEEVYVTTSGYVDPDHPKKVYKVVKALYGLHQAHRAWYVTLSTFLEEHRYRRGTIDKTLFIKKDKKDIMLVQVYVDDIIFGSTRKSWCDEFEALMKGRFQMSSMGELIFFLGLQVKQKTDGIFISQDKYVADMLKKFDLVSVKTAITPMETKMALTKDEEADEVDVHLYRSMIGSLMYLTADIMFVVCACSRFQVTPKTSHLNAVKRIFKYLKGKPNLGLWYPRESSFDLEAFSDSDYVGANLDRKSTTGGCQFLGSRLISWQCKKQTIVATSTTEAEYVAATSCCGQVLWIQNQMLDYGFNFMNTKIHIDNESTICIVKNPVYHSKTKHIEIRHHFIRDSYEKKLIRVEKIHTDFNVADLLTKAFDGPRFNFLVVNIVDNNQQSQPRYYNFKRMASLKYYNKHNQVGFLKKPKESAGFSEIVDFLKGSHIKYALTHNPTIHDSLVKQFWQTATASTLADGTLELRATIDTHEYTITEASVRSKLQLADASGISMLPNTEIFEGMGNMGYPTDGSFTFWKSFFTPQWRFLVHHILHCISPKSGGWDQFGSNIATALICLSTGKVYNFSKLIFDGMVANLKSQADQAEKLILILRATIDTLEYTITEAFVQSKLQLADALGISMLPNTEIFERMGNIGYPTDGQADQAGTQSQPSSSTVPPPPTSQPVPTDSTTIPPTPITEPTSEPSSPFTAPEHETMEHPFEQPSPEHQPSSPRQESDIPQTQAPTHTHEADTRHMSVDDLFQLVPQLMTRIKSLEKDLKQTKQTMGNVIVKLVKKVKKMEKVVKSRRVVLTDSEDDDAKNSSKQGRNLQKDESEVFETPKQGKSSGEIDISPQDIKSASVKVSSGGEHVSQREGKAVLEETPQTKRTKKQIREEQASLAEIARIQAKDETVKWS